MSIKTLIVEDSPSLTGEYAYIERMADGYILENSATGGHTLGAFYSQATVNDKKIPMTENATLAGVYEVTENRITFNDGKYKVRYCETDGTIIASEDWDVLSDAVLNYPAGVATPTNITAGTITNVTNLTNAPTAGDFTATMKTSLQNAWPDMQTTIDELEVLIEQLGAYTLGAGGTAQTYTLTVGGLPCEDAYVVMSTDIDMLNPIHSGRTNALGQITFYPNLPTGTTVYMWSFKADTTFSNPDIETIA